MCTHAVHTCTHEHACSSACVQKKCTYTHIICLHAITRSGFLVLSWTDRLRFAMLTWFNFSTVIISTRCVQAIFCLPLDESGEWRLSDAPMFVCGSSFELCVRGRPLHCYTHCTDQRTDHCTDLLADHCTDCCTHHSPLHRPLYRLPPGGSCIFLAPLGFLQS